LRANSALTAAIRRSALGGEAVILFDDPATLPRWCTDFQKSKRRFFFVLWDGLTPAALVHIETVKQRLGPSFALSLVVVGDCPAQLTGGLTSYKLFPEGALTFDSPLPRFSLQTNWFLALARLKAVLMPLKNLAYAKGSREAFALLWGKRQVVFCGAYGLHPSFMADLCERHSVDDDVMLALPQRRTPLAKSAEPPDTYLEEAGRCLAQLYGEARIDEPFFLSVVRLLGREFFVERLHATGLPLFTNAYGSGKNINVYTTPAYRQHLFPDFGSVAGSGNYPRLADLMFFRKQTILIDLGTPFSVLLETARQGQLQESFQQEWQRKLPQILSKIKKN
jgi:hypothetical protein